MVLPIVDVKPFPQGVNAATCYIDRDIDSLMVKTMRRTLPTGRIKPAERTLHLGVTLIATSMAILLVRLGKAY